MLLMLTAPAYMMIWWNFSKNRFQLATVGASFLFLTGSSGNLSDAGHHGKNQARASARTSAMC